ncbi:cytochrome b562 [Gallibacterium salpingitidis]|uniref:cytochrome b562 n=1 Tax=Gallibacterium salpingitidis TaxID=505341 RepID=UPI00266F92B9|nr:cytochrome b562 [Gallibacterium salpingitidis]WKT00561.1 cytochrome b562 [Gallibacterium salpingitidis]
MKTTTLMKTVLFSGLLAFSAFSMADTVVQEMQFFAKNIGPALKADNAETMQKHLSELKAAAQRSLDLVPGSLANKGKDSAEFKDYQQGMQHFIAVIDESSALAAKGELEQAKEKAKTLLSIRNDYHKKYK